jgi:hypothetical protein
MKKVLFFMLAGLLVLSFSGMASAAQTWTVTVEGFADFFGFPAGPNAKVKLLNAPQGFAFGNRDTDTDASGFYQLQDPGIKQKNVPQDSKVRVIWKLQLFGGAVCLKFKGLENITFPAQMLPGQTVDIAIDIPLWFDSVC